MVAHRDRHNYLYKVECKMSNNYELNDLTELGKIKKIRKTKVHRQPIIFDDDREEVKPRKQAGKKKHSRNINNVLEFGLDDEDGLEEYIHYLK